MTGATPVLYIYICVANKENYWLINFLSSTAARIQRERSLSPHMLTAHAQFSPPQQLSSRGRSRTRHSSEAMGGREVMRYDERGLVTIFVKWRGNSPQRNLSVLVSHLLKVRRPVLTVSLSLSLPPFLSSSPPLPPSLPSSEQDSSQSCCNRWGTGSAFCTQAYWMSIHWDSVRKRLITSISFLNFHNYCVPTIGLYGLIR